jgi:hypothetical protein
MFFETLNATVEMQYGNQEANANGGGLIGVVVLPWTLVPGAMTCRLSARAHIHALSPFSLPPP